MVDMIKSSQSWCYGLNKSGCESKINLISELRQEPRVKLIHIGTERIYSPGAISYVQRVP